MYKILIRLIQLANNGDRLFCLDQDLLLSHIKQRLIFRMTPEVLQGQKYLGETFRRQEVYSISCKPKIQPLDLLPLVDWICLASDSCPIKLCLSLKMFPFSLAAELQ